MSEQAGAEVAEQFESLEQQAHAARLGMWVFLGSEMLLFAGLFALYVVYRVQHPLGFAMATHHNTWALASVNTAILLSSSFSVAMAVHALREGRRAMSVVLVLFTVLCGAAFLAIKLTEYGKHFDEGIYPGGVGRFFTEHAGPGDRGMMLFFTLYYAMTGLHAVHIVAGMGVLIFLAWRTHRGRVNATNAHPLELGAAYWHLVDLVWIFLWPLFYLMPGGSA
jgi:cytochrome c oxidase subunit 3